MEELKLLIDMVAHLPQMALWVLVGFFAYKVVIVGSIYGVIRLAIVKVHDVLMAPRVAKFQLGTKQIDAETGEALNAQIARLASTNYIHMSDVAKLRKAIDAMEQPPKKP